MEREAVSPGCDRLSKRVAVIKFCAVPVSLQFWEDKACSETNAATEAEDRFQPGMCLASRWKSGFYRDGCCNTGQEDVGSHTVCAVMTAEFLAYFEIAR